MDSPFLGSEAIGTVSSSRHGLPAAVKPPARQREKERLNNKELTSRLGMQLSELST